MDIENKTIRTFTILAIFIPIMAILAVTAPSWIRVARMDFSMYWQAGNMNFRGLYVYDQPAWDANVIRPGLDKVFNYPLPFAILMTPFGMLFIEKAYVIWIFFAQTSLLITAIMIMSFKHDRSARFELIALIGVLFFRPIFTVIFSGQLGTFLLLFLALSISLFHKQKWLFGGIILSLLCLKPSFGVFILAFAGTWFLFQKHFQALFGVGFGVLGLLLLGMARDIGWAMDYIRVGRHIVNTYVSINTTIWGIVGLLFEDDAGLLILGIILFMILSVAELFFLWRGGNALSAFAVISSATPLSLILAPYSWSYDQILLVIPILYVAIQASRLWGEDKSVLVFLAVDALAMALVVIAYSIGHDIWSALVPLFVWGGVIVVTFWKPIPVENVQY
jgi:hypothetical protein